MNEEKQGFPKLKKNDLVMVISGKHKGKTGKILRLIKDKNQVVVDKINVVKRHTKPNQKDPKGGIIEKEAPLHVCKVLPVSSMNAGKAVRISVWLREGARSATAKTKSKARGAK